jgi:hypothetical protein
VQLLLGQIVERIYGSSPLPRELVSTARLQEVLPGHRPEQLLARARREQRRFATYAFPGLVLAFYSYFWLRAGDWEAYFDGRWTRQPATRELVLGAGFFFAPWVPAVLAATLTLGGFALASFAFFHGAEAATRRRGAASAIGIGCFARRLRRFQPVPCSPARRRTQIGTPRSPSRQRWRADARCRWERSRRR